MTKFQPFPHSVFRMGVSQCSSSSVLCVEILPPSNSASSKVSSLFGPECVFGCQDNVQKVSEALLALLRFGPQAIFDDSLHIGSAGPNFLTRKSSISANRFFCQSGQSTNTTDTISEMMPTLWL